MSIAEVKQIIANSKFDPGLKQRLILLLPRLGKFSLNGLGAEVSRGDSLFIADYLVSLWENFADLLDGLKKSNTLAFKNFFELFASTQNRLNQDDRLYFLSLVIDVRGLAYDGSTNLTVEQYQKLLDYEISLFWNLPREEILFFLQHYLLLLISRTDLLKNVQVVVYDRSWDYQGDFGKNFSDALLKNKEVLGQAAAKPIGSWIEEFISFSPVPTSQRNIVFIAEFLARNAGVRKLSDTEKSYLSQILKLFLWFLNGEVDEKEIRTYKEQVNDQEAAKIEAQLLRETPFGLRAVSRIETQQRPVSTLLPRTKKFNDLMSAPVTAISGREKRVSNSSPPVPPRPPRAVVAEKPAVAEPTNEKTAQLRADFGSVQSGSPDPHSSLKHSIADAKNLSSVVDLAGIEPADTSVTSEGRNQIRPTTDILYHEPVNIQDVLSQRQSMPEALKQAQGGGLAGKDQKAAPSTPGLSFANPGLSDIVDIKALEEAAKKKRAEEEAKVNQKLEELKKRLGQN